MERAELIRQLDENPRYDYIEMEDGALVVADLKVSVDSDPDHHPLTHIIPDAIAKNDPGTIRALCAHGRDVEQITRVTGYFSRVASWNKGKTAELRDRHRSVVRREHGRQESESRTNAP